MMVRRGSSWRTLGFVIPFIGADPSAVDGVETDSRHGDRRQRLDLAGHRCPREGASPRKKASTSI